MKLLEKRAREGKPTPALDNRPLLNDRESLAWRAFASLSPKRSSGFDAGAITATDILAWLEIHDISDLDQRMDVYNLVGMLDQVYLDHREAERVRKEKEGKRDADSTSRD